MEGTHKHFAAFASFAVKAWACHENPQFEALRRREGAGAFCRNPGAPWMAYVFSPSVYAGCNNVSTTRRVSKKTALPPS